MSIQELISKLKILKAEIEWDLSIEYQIVLDETISILEDKDGRCSEKMDRC